TATPGATSYLEHPLRPVLSTKAGAVDSLADLEDEERDRDVLAGDRNNGQRVKELVVAEHTWRRVGAAPRVDDGAGRVGQSSNDEQNHRRRVEAGHQLRQRHDGDPPER